MCIRDSVETVHAYTNDQNLIDNFHKGDRRGRSAALNMVLTETGAAKAVSKALPEFEGKLTGNAIRVPTPDVSMAVLNLQFEREVTREEINEHLEPVSLTGALRTQIDYVESPDVGSMDFVLSLIHIPLGLRDRCDQPNFARWLPRNPNARHSGGQHR